MTPGVCHVCAYLDADVTVKPVAWCGACSAYLCSACIGNPFRRARAALERWLGL